MSNSKDTFSDDPAASEIGERLAKFVSDYLAALDATGKPRPPHDELAHEIAVAYTDQWLAESELLAEHTTQFGVDLAVYKTSLEVAAYLPAPPRRRWRWPVRKTDR